MNQGGEQGRDDYGLPPVDIEIPDDARELFRDVQAYHRELRALRRQERSTRWRAPFRRSGVAVPLLAGGLIVALVAVMISAMFTQNPYVIGASGRHASSPSAGSGANGGSARAGGSSASAKTTPSSALPGTPPTATGHLPGKTINVAGKQVQLSTVMSAALAIVPANCNCKAAVVRLLAQAQSAGVIVYLVGPRGSKIADLYRLVTPSARRAKSTRVATDDNNVLTSAFRAVGLTVLLIDSRGLVTVASKLGPNLMLTRQLQLLRRRS